jgi:hypothetical protein
MVTEQIIDTAISGIIGIKVLDTGMKMIQGKKPKISRKRFL